MTTIKVMISISKEIYDKAMKEIDERYYGKIGGQSIFFEDVLRKHFNGKSKK